MVQLNEKGYEKMTDNVFTDLDANVAQLNALMEVIREITQSIPYFETYELSAKRVIKKLQSRVDNCNVLDDSELVDLLNQAIDEIKFLLQTVARLYVEVGR